MLDQGLKLSDKDPGEYYHGFIRYFHELSPEIYTEYLEKTLALSKTPLVIAKTHVYIANNYIDFGKMDLAVKHLKQALPLGEKLFLEGNKESLKIISLSNLVIGHETKDVAQIAKGKMYLNELEKEYPGYFEIDWMKGFVKDIDMKRAPASQ
jgi:hypothetical protein